MKMWTSNLLWLKKYAYKESKKTKEILSRFESELKAKGMSDTQINKSIGELEDTAIKIQELYDANMIKQGTTPTNFGSGFKSKNFEEFPDYFVGSEANKELNRLHAKMNNILEDLGLNLGQVKAGIVRVEPTDKIARADWLGAQYSQGNHWFGNFLEPKWQDWYKGQLAKAYNIDPVKGPASPFGSPKFHENLIIYDKNGKLATGISEAEARANPKKYMVVDRKDNYLDLRGLNLNAKTFLNNVMFDNSNKMVRAWRDKRFFKLDDAGQPIKGADKKPIIEQIGYDLGIIDNIRDPNILGTDIVVRNPERFQLVRKNGGHINYN